MLSFETQENAQELHAVYCRVCNVQYCDDLHTVAWNEILNCIHASARQTLHRGVPPGVHNIGE